jgi:hypothetical protein
LAGRDVVSHGRGDCLRGCDFGAIRAYVPDGATLDGFAVVEEPLLSAENHFAA